MRLIDVNHLGRDRVIGCWDLDGVLIDPGPASSVESLLEGLGGQEPRALLLTHIHLDHAGAAGTLVKRWPGLQVYVHERGAPHVVDPSKLLASAARLYGGQMERLWGEVLPVPAENVHALSGGERVEGLHVAYTPGHASHHVSYFDPGSGRAFVGDTGGVIIPPGDLLVAPTPPPDVDLESWESSIDLIAEWSPQSLGLTHFDSIADPESHMDRLRRRLSQQFERVRQTTLEQFVAELRDEVARELDPETGERMLQALPPDQQWLGLDRYRRKREESAAG